MENKKTLVLGASPNPDRYSFKAVEMLSQHGYGTIAVGIKKGEIAGIEILTGIPEQKDIDTLSLYLGAGNQKQYYDYIISLSPKRVIFNPGTENPELEGILKSVGAEIVHGCTLVMLRTSQF
jgi:uncharacterized protein